MQFRIDWTPPTLGKQLRTHPMKLPGLVKVAAVYIVAAIGKPAAREQRKVRVRLTLHRKPRRKIKDDDNLHGMCKPLFDAIVRLGWAWDDSRKFMEQVVDPVVPDRDEFTEIELEVAR